VYADWQQSQTARIWSPHYTMPSAWLHKSHLACYGCDTDGLELFHTQDSYDEAWFVTESHQASCGYDRSACNWVTSKLLTLMIALFMTKSHPGFHGYNSLVCDWVTPGFHGYHNFVCEWVTSSFPQLQQGWVVTEWHPGCHGYEKVWF